MGKAISAVLLAAALVFAGTTGVLAKGGGHGHGGHGHGLTHGGGFPPGFSKGRKVGWGGKDTPPGWSHGQKVGWGGGHEPPGLARH